MELSPTCSRGLASFESESVHPVGRYSNADVGESQRGRYGFRDNRKDLFGGERGVETPSELGEYAGGIAAIAVDNAIDTTLQRGAQRREREGYDAGRGDSGGQSAPTDERADRRRLRVRTPRVGRLRAT